MSKILLEITPSSKSRFTHKKLGMISGFFAATILVFILWLLVSGHSGTWTIIILVFPMLLFALVSWFVLKFGKAYVVGMKLTDEGLGPCYPEVREPGQREKIIKYSDIQMLIPEENLELHRAGRKLQRFNIYRIYIIRKGESEPELLVDMHDLEPEQILNFRRIPGILLESGFLAPGQIDLGKMP